jgi:hypothetical protein
MPRLSSASLALAAVSFLAGGCDLLDVLNAPGDTLVTVFANHHATPEDGRVPDRGGDGELRVFENDEGWTVHLTEGLITTKGATLERCDGVESAVDFYFGSVAEDLRSADLDRTTLGGTEVGAGAFCGLTVHYGQFSAETDEAPTVRDLAVVDGTTIYLAGYAERGEQTVPFEIAVEAERDVHIDFEDLPGGELRISGDEPFPVELTVSKTYDRFFDGVDFGTVSADDLQQNALAVLELETRADLD